MKNATISTTGSTNINLEYSGCVKDVIEGKIAKETKSRYIDARRYNIGFGCASPIDCRSLGDSLLVNDRCYTKSTQQDSELYQKIIFGNEFITTGFTFVSDNSPTYVAKMEEGATDLVSLLDWIYERVRTPFVISGFILFANLKATHLNRPPISGENIFAEKEKYFPAIQQDLDDVHGYVVGVVTDPNELRLSKINKKLSVCLYPNPLDKHTDQLQHIHVLTLSKKCVHKEEILPGNVLDCVEVLIEGTKIESFDLEIYSINDVVEINSTEQKDKK